MKNYQYLNIKGTNLEEAQLENYLTQLAEEHVISKQSEKNTYPIKKVEENFNNILETYELLNKHLKLGIKVHSAGEWLLDNFYIIEEIVRNIQKSMTVKKYIKLPGIANGKHKGFARVYVLASEIIAFSDESISEEKIIKAINSYQTRKILSMEEIWNIGIFMEIAIIQKISDICDKIYYSQIQKYKVENIYERLVELKPSQERKFKEKIKNKKQIEDLNYSFIEYMVYKLRRIGKKGNPYIEILEKQISKLGTNTDDIVKKEHLYIATLKIKIGVCITSLKAINRISFQKIFEKTNKTEELLNNDPSGIFPRQTEDTKELYRAKIKKISVKTKISEIYITEEILRLANRYKEAEDTEEKRKSHVGYYLIDEGIYELKEAILEKKVKRKSKKFLSRLYIYSIVVLPLLGDFEISELVGRTSISKIILFLILYIPLYTLILRIINYIISRIVKPLNIPKINYENGIDDECKTMVVIPTILDSKEKVEEMFKKIEIYYLANEDKNIFFTLLGDCTTSVKEVEKSDEDVINTGLQEKKRLNEKYNVSNKFNFVYRKRKWNPKEERYLGWERKRGLLIQFNELILKKEKTDFIANTLEDFDEKIKYIITLDSDTNLVLESAQKMIGAMSHILNKPVIKDGAVKIGYGIMQPRIGITLEDSQKTMFTKIFSSNPGIDFYTNAIFDIYQDCFKEGIFTGKGIYDLEVYQQLIKSELPENRILSHDLLEGNYLRCALLSDVVLLDSFPKQYLSYVERENRWIRGDWQIASWIEKVIFNKRNPINNISKFKIFDNLIRSILPISQLILFITALDNKNFSLLLITLATIYISSILETINKIIFRKSITEEKIYADKKFYRNISGIRGTFLRNSIELTFLPTAALNSFLAIIKTLYRLRIGKKLLEWKTSDSVDKAVENTLEYYCQKMLFNILIGIIMFGLLNPLGMVVGTLWIFAPYIAWILGQSIARNRKIAKEDKEYLEKIAEETWKYFETSFKKENNYLVPDNYQLGRKNEFVMRTSSTNIGLEILSIISAYDLKIITLDKALEMIKKVINTINNLVKWNGHLYNWYNIKTLEPLKPEYVSTVDSGNFIGYLYVLRNFLITKQIDDDLLKNVEKIINNTDFNYLYEEKQRLFSIGFDISSNKLSDSYYDFLASEARQASFIAIAKKDIKYKHWINLSRTLTSLNGYKGLISWSGTAFEYTMPNLIMEIPEGSLIDEACKFARRCQIEYANKNNVPWGISESAYSLKDLQGNYQYKAFGIPMLGLKRGLEEELVISPYATILFLEYDVSQVVENLKEIEKYNMRSKYGFYDALDFTRERINVRKKYEPVKTYMAHHQGLILNTINNILNKDILRKRFMKNPEIESIKILLNERMPDTVVLSKEKRNNVSKGKYVSIYDDKETLYLSDEKYDRYNAISSDYYTNVIDIHGRGYSKLNNIQVNRFRNRIDCDEGIGVYFKNIQTKKIWSSFESDKVIFSQGKEEFIKQEENIETKVKVFLAPDESAEIRQINLKNTGILKETIETYFFLEPLLSNIQDDIAHPAYNNMFLKFNYLADKKILLCSRKINDKEIYLGIKIIANENQELEFELEKEKFIGRNSKTPKAILDSSKFSSEEIETVEPIIAFRTKVEIEPKKEEKINCILHVSEEKDEIIKYLTEINSEKVEIISELAKAKSEEEIKFLEINGEKIENNQKILGHLIEKDIPREVNTTYKIEEVWKFGISGDNPIILLEIKNIEELYVLEELLETIEFFNVKNIRIDLCVLNNEKMSYETFVKDGINEVIKNHRLEYLRNNQIFVLNKNELTPKDIETIETIADIKLFGNIGGIKNNLEEIENNKKEEVQIQYKEIGTSEKIAEDELEYDNEIGGFTKDEYILKIEKNNIPPRAWSNIIANPKFGTVTTENSGGYTWIENSRLKRITTWENDAIQDFKSEEIIIKDIDNNEYWDLGNNAEKNSYQVKYGMGYSKYMQINNALIQENTILVPLEEEIKINHITIKNKDRNKRRLHLYYAINVSMGEERQKNIGKIKANKKDNFIELENICKSNFKEKIEITSSEKIKSYTNNYQNFFSSKMSPENGVNKKELKPEGNILIKNEIIVEIPVELGGFERKSVDILLGKDLRRYVENYNTEKELEKIEQYWKDKTEKIKIKTPSEKINLYMNKWLIYQTITSRLNAKTGFYQSGGAIGFRDQLQDALGMKWIDEKILYNQILEVAKHQFIEGDVMHWWHVSNKTGIRTRISDDLLWLPYSVIEYIEFTEDESILDKEVEYTKGIQLNDDENEKYGRYEYTEEKETIYEHCIKAIEKSLNFGENGFPKIGTGDWNDGFNRIGHKGKGESIWLGFFLYDILNRWEKILEKKNEIKRIGKYKEIKNELKKRLNTKGWDGEWYQRAVTDDGNIIGGSQCKEGKIDSIAQSWSIISEAGDNEKKYIALESAKKYLIDEENKIIKLLSPPFKDDDLDPGYIKRYPAGVRENGGQYTHSSIWLIMAFAKMGYITEAVKYLEMINPITHTENIEKVKKYKIEPYVIAGDVYTNKYMTGRGGWSWYTGSSSWYYKVCLENILGLKKKGNKLYLPENMPDNWENYEIQYRYGTNLYNIKVEQKADSDRKKQFFCNGIELEKNYIELKNDNKIENLEIKL